MAVLAKWKNSEFNLPLCGPLPFHPVMRTELDFEPGCFCLAVVGKDCVVRSQMAGTDGYDAILGFRANYSISMTVAGCPSVSYSESNVLMAPIAPYNGAVSVPITYRYLVNVAGEEYSLVLRYIRNLSFPVGVGTEFQFFTSFRFDPSNNCYSTGGPFPLTFSPTGSSGAFRYDCRATQRDASQPAGPSTDSTTNTTTGIFEAEDVVGWSLDDGRVNGPPVGSYTGTVEIISVEYP